MTIGKADIRMEASLLRPGTMRPVCGSIQNDLWPPHWVAAGQGTSAVLKTLLRAFADHILVAIGRLRRPRRFWQARLPSMFATLILLAFQIVLLGQGALHCFAVGSALPPATQRDGASRCSVDAIS